LRGFVYFVPTHFVCVYLQIPSAPTYSSVEEKARDHIILHTLSLNEQNCVCVYKSKQNIIFEIIIIHITHEIA
jgi:hypothetical protein